MQNPVSSAVDAFVTIFDNLPPAVHALCYLSLAVLFLTAIISLLWHLR